MVVHESVPAVPSGFAHAGSVPSTTEITLRIALTQSDIAGLQAKAYAVSDPSNAIYGQYLTPDEVATYVSPTAETLSAVSQWLSENNINSTSVSSAGNVLQISLPISKANDLLAAQFTSFTHIASGKTFTRTLSYSVPVSLQPHINYVHPTVAFIPPLNNAPRVTAVKPKESSVQGRAAVAAGCASQVNPSMYDFPAAKANNSKSNTLGVAGFSNEYANSADLQLFLRTFLPGSVGTNFSVIEIDGGQNDQTLAESGIEAVLDVEMTVGLAKGVPVTFISVGSDNEDGIDGFLDIINSIMAMPAATRPTVLTTSYGFNEPDLPVSLAYSLCDSYVQLGAAGISVIFASGDGGVGGIQSAECTSFVPTAPAACPFVTAVGGSTGLPPQSAASLSGGGFSNYFVTPGYQYADVTKYVASIGDKYSGLYYSNGRGFPDIALQAENLWLVNGTSAASPIFASMVALLNDRLIAAGKPVLGFLNPFLYSTAGRAAFTDITSGNNPGCNTNGFSASPGWDPVSGLGTPTFNSLLSALGLS
ncbi:family S53 protease [Mycena metata]|uniref:tripeptidyl-peptidase II n=1 Tax=Mycena metata TaxID=1033252 RepID=A0AAD7I2M9_9AGAR|nr:family S53 protease [Mycena metata]